MWYHFLMPKKKIMLLVALALTAAFLCFSFLVYKGRFIHTDFDMTVKVQDKVPHTLDGPFSVLSILAQAEVIGVFWLLLFVYLLVRRYWVAAAAMFLMPIGLVIELYGKLFIHHPAPPHLFYRGIFDFNLPTHYVHTPYSYPSGHMFRTSFMLVFLMGYLFLKTDLKKQLPFQLILIAGILLMGISRVYLGEHWTSDVVGGFFLGGCLGMFAAITLPSPKRITNNE